MSEHVSWMLELEIKPGCDAAVRALMLEMVAATSADEPGTLDYEWHADEDGKQLHVFERYADSAATLAHLGNFGAKFAARFMELLTPSGFVIYGAPSAEVRSALAGLAPTYMARVGGFSR